MYTVLIVFHVLLATALVAVVLVQRGPGATMGAAFGSGASGTVFGSRGATGFLTKLTSWLGVAFFGVSLTMAVLVARSGDVGQNSQDLGVADQLVEQPDEASGNQEQGTAAESESTDAGEEEFLEVPVEEEPTGEDTQQPPRVD